MTTQDNKQSEHRLIAERRASLQVFRDQGVAFTNDFRPSHEAALLHETFVQLNKAMLAAEPEPVAVAGRIMSRRLMGKASFITLQDHSGQIQCYIRRDHLGDETCQLFAKHFDIGDVIGVEGHLMRTNTGELTIAVEQLRLLAKALRPLPDKHSGLADVELKYRQRYLDLIMHGDTKLRFRQRSKIIDSLRAFFSERGFLEVETPIMHPIAGGATARPFLTHHHALSQDMYLRVAPELYLKRLVVGGFERVFELNRNFRNEGLSRRHNPEFTMLEFYQAYADYHDLMALTEELLLNLVQDLFGSSHFVYQGKRVELIPDPKAEHPIPRMSLYQALVYYTKQDEDVLTSVDKLAALLRANKVDVQPGWGLGKLQMELFEAEVEAKLWQPVFITEYPIEISPLARRNTDNPEIADRFELFIAGREVANGFSELNDPEDQADRFRLQAQAAAQGDDESMHFDADYITALEYGMPPTAGEGIGVDRLVMLLVDAASIRDVLLFPHLKTASDSR